MHYLRCTGVDELLDWEEPDLYKAERLLKMEAGQSEVKWVRLSPDPDQSGCEELCSGALTPDRGLNTLTNIILAWIYSAVKCVTLDLSVPRVSMLRWSQL